MTYSNPAPRVQGAKQKRKQTVRASGVGKHRETVITDTAGLMHHEAAETGSIHSAYTGPSQIGSQCERVTGQ